MSIKNDGNKIPDVVMSPSNFKMEYVADEETIYNGTISKYTVITEGKKGGTYVGVETGISKQVSTTLKKLIADGDVVVLNGTPATVVSDEAFVEPVVEETVETVEAEEVTEEIEEVVVTAPKKTRKKKDA